MAGSPTSRSLAILRKNGYCVDVVERRVGRFITRDFLGYIDLIGCSGDAGVTIGIQATSRSNQSSRINKIADSEELSHKCAEWIRAGNKFEVWGWGKRTRKTKKGTDKTVWTVVRTKYGLSDCHSHYVVTDREENDSGSELVF